MLSTTVFASNHHHERHMHYFRQPRCLWSKCLYCNLCTKSSLFLAGDHVSGIEGLPRDESGQGPVYRNARHCFCHSDYHHHTCRSRTEPQLDEQHQHVDPVYSLCSISQQKREPHFSYLSGVVLCSFEAAQEVEAGKMDGSGNKGTGWTKRIKSNAQRIWHLLSDKLVLTLGFIHLSLMAAIGIWVWLNPSKLITVLGAPSRFSSPALRVVSLFMDFLVLIPGLNLFPPFVFFLALQVRSGTNYREKT